MKIGIIGHKGFVGSAFFEAFSQGGKYEVTGIDREGHEGLAGTRFGILINCNGNSSKRLADDDPRKDFGMNVIDTLGFLADFPSDHYVHVSTVEVYNDVSSRSATREDAKIDPIALTNYGFSKYCGELVAMRHASWMVLRLAGMVGPGMKKGPAHDIMAHGRLYMSEKSCLHFMETREVARIARLLCERGRWGKVYNVVGKGTVELKEFAAIAGRKLSAAGSEVRKFDVCTEKLGGETPVQTSEQAVRTLVKGWNGASHGV